MFEGDTNFFGKRVFEYYDRGYLITGYKDTNSFNMFGWLYKSDINGYRLWEKLVGDSQSSIQFSSLVILNNGDITLIGERKNNGSHDPMIIKLNSCGEKQWCKIYDAINQYGWGQDIIALPDGGYMAVIMNWVESEENKPVWLFRLNEDGEIIWQQYYPQDSMFWFASAIDLNFSFDSTVIITGDAYTPDTINPFPVYHRPMIVKVDLNGNAVFELSWGREKGYLGAGFASILDNSGNIYTAVSHYRVQSPYGDSPGLLKTSLNGSQLFDTDLTDSTISGGAGALTWFQDSTLLINGVWTGPNPGDTSICGIFKTDSIGTIMNEKNLFILYTSFSDAITTFDNKVVMVGGFGLQYPFWQTMMIKLNSDLEYDSIYTTPIAYDSLCPYPIVSDTIPLDDCEVIVDIDEPMKNPEKTELKVFPNPAFQKITIELPRYLARRTGGQADGRTGEFGISTTTIYHQWKEVRLEVYDLFGRLKFSELIPQSEKNIELDVSTWPGGMYVARLVFMNDIVATAKFVVE